MFKDNQHTKEYYSIIESAKERGGKYKTRYMARKHLGYVEHHHVIPESMGGNDTLDNKVWVTAHEHLRCHLLLTEMCENNGHRHKMLLAVTRMMNRQDSRRERETMLPLQITQEEIDWLSQIRVDSAKAHSEYMSEKFKGEGNPFYGKTHTVESNESRRKKLEGVPISAAHKKATSEGRLKNSAHISAIVTGTKNPRYNPTIYNWENINTGEKKSSTRFEMITADPKLKSGISGVITGKAEQYKGWRIVQ